MTHIPPELLAQVALLVALQQKENKQKELEESNRRYEEEHSLRIPAPR